MSASSFFITAVAILSFSQVSFAQKWAPKKAALMTRFASNVNPDQVLPEYPRPQLARSRWMNLNGLWQFQAGTDAAEGLPEGALSGTILVPFPVESALSGVMEHHERLWYRRSFTIPANWKGDRVLLHFGAVDYESEIFVNGESLGVHKGGYDPFSFDITPALSGSGKQEITVRVFDPTDDGGYPRGKQTLHPRGIMYTSVTGIWQTVWLEPVAPVSIDGLTIVPDVDQSRVQLTVHTYGNVSGMTVSVKVKDGGHVIKTVTGGTNVSISIPIPNAKLWSPDRPFLYDLGVVLLRGHAVADSVSSYFGMRKISLGEAGGYKKLFLNNKFLFEIGPLDQGFWPDGIYTAPTDEAIRNDLSVIKSLGFNMVRKHIKVEPYRWYYWADKLGLLVWQDMPSPNSYTEHTPPVDTAAYADELTRMINTHRNSPSIVMWVVFNEAQGQHNTAGLVEMVRALDPSRLINQASGGNHFGVGDVLDIHSYPAPACPASTTQALACGEYGGIGFKIKGHLWQDGFGYVMDDNVKDYTNRYDQFARDLTVFKTNNGLSAAVYTETTDVEGELNGVMTYDRVLKAPSATIKASNELAIHSSLYLSEILPTSAQNARTWKYTFDRPDSGWYGTHFDDGSWKSGEAGFGTRGTPGAVIRTVWDTKDIWLRQEFNPGNLTSIQKEELALSIHHDDDCIVYINGVKAAELKGYTSGYTSVALSAPAKNALVSNGKNTIAIYCKQLSGGQYIDAGISLVSKVKR